MSTVHADPAGDRYALERTPEEYARLRGQARVWEEATRRLLDRVPLDPGASCLDAGCGPGETMRLLAERVGPGGRVLGVDLDASLGRLAEADLHAAGHRHCAFRAHDVTAAAPIPGAPFDLVYVRLLLFHLPDRAGVLARLWESVAPGGHLVVQDYDLRASGVHPALESADAMLRVLVAAFAAAGADPYIGGRLPELFRHSGIGAPDGTDVAGRLEPLASGRWVLEHTYRSTLETAFAHGITSRQEAAAALAAFDRDVARHGERGLYWPLLVGAFKRKARP